MPPNKLYLKPLGGLPFSCQAKSCPKKQDSYDLRLFRDANLNFDTFKPQGCMEYKTHVVGAWTQVLSQDEWEQAPLIGCILPCPDATGAQGSAGGFGAGKDILIDALVREFNQPVRIAFFFLTRGYSFSKATRGDIVQQPVNKAAISNCYPYLLNDLEKLKPTKLLLCGQEACETFFKGSVDVPTLRRKKGLSVRIGNKSYPIQVTYSPHYAIMMPVYIQSIREDAGKLAGKGYTFQGGSARILKTLDETLDYLDFLSEHEGFIAFDTETENLNRKAPNKLGTLQFATDDQLGVVLPYQHKETPFGPDELVLIKKRLSLLFSKKIKAAGWVIHNAKFEHTVCKNHFGTFVDSAPVFDTQAMAFLLDETRSERKMDIPKGTRGIYSLKALSRDYLGFSGYDQGVLQAREEGTLMDLTLDNLADYGCFTKGNKVLLAGGRVKDISEVKVGDLVVTHKNRLRKVVKTWVKPYQGKLYNLYFKNGFSIEGVTPNHPILVQTESGQKWSRVDELNLGCLCFKQGDNTQIPQKEAWLEILNTAKNILIEENKQKSARARSQSCSADQIDALASHFEHPDFWWFLGLCLAEGSVRHKLRGGLRVAAALSLALHQKELEEAKKIIGEIFPGIHLSIVGRKNNLGVEIVICNRALAIVFDVLLQTMNKVEKKASTIVHLHPSLFYSLSKGQACEVLSGYFDGDGHFKITTQDAIQAISNTTSINLSTQLQLLLQKVDSHYTKKTIFHGTKYGKCKAQKNTSYWLTIFGGSCFWWNSRFDKIKKKPSALLAKKHSPYLELDYIETCEADTEVYNCEVEEDNSYVCNGIRVHNSMDAYVTFALYERIQELASEQGYLKQLMKLTEHYYSPAIRLIALVEMTGFKTDLKQLRLLASRRGPLETKIMALEEKMKAMPAFQEANLKAVKRRNANHTMGARGNVPWVFDFAKDEDKKTVFFNVLGLEPVSFSEKTGQPAIDDEFFEEYSEENPEVAAYAEYTEAKKMRDTFISKMLERVDPETGDPDCKLDQRIRSNIWYARLVTGRWAMTEPNMHAIPKAEEGGSETDFLVRKSVKDIFTVDPGYALMQVDYKVNEVRWAGILSQDKALAKIFNDADLLMKEARLSEDPARLKDAAFKEDIHRNTASETFGVPLSQVSKAQRQASKSITFGIMFQSSANSIATSLGIELQQAEEYIKKFFNKMSGVDSWIKRIKFFAAQNGYVETPTGRRRRFWSYELPESYRNKRSHTARNDRQSVNAPIQGIANDGSMLGGACSLHDYIEAHQKDWKIQNLVHDSCLIQMPIEDVADAILAMESIFVDQAMRRLEKLGVQFNLPLAIDVEVGFNWGSLNKWSGTRSHAFELQQSLRK
jgi:DNA polymerase I-like protein with 3'-5' exonuclease and polymerase domains